MRTSSGHHLSTRLRAYSSRRLQRVPPAFGTGMHCDICASLFHTIRLTGERWVM